MWLAIQFVIKEGKKDNIVDVAPADYVFGNYNEESDEFIDDNNNHFHLISNYFNLENKNERFFGFPILIEELEKSFGKLSCNEELAEEYFCEVGDYDYFIQKGMIDKILLTKYSDRNNSVCILDVFRDFNTAFCSLEEYCDNYEEYTENHLFDPEKVLNALKERVIAQDDAASKLVNTIYMNIKYSEFQGLKSNILIAGPPGTGKTELIRSLSQITSIPMVVEDITKYTSSGYVGGNVISMLEDLYFEAGKNIKAAEKGIIVIDEADKMCSSQGESSTIRKNDVQEELLGLLDGNVYTIKGGDINTKNITFILIGAFSKITDKRIDKRMNLGFESKNNFYESTIKTEQFYDFGMNAELLRRVPIRIFTNELTKDDLKKILTKSSISNLKIFEKALAEKDNANLVYTDKTLDAIIEVAQKFKGGASGLKNAVTATLTPAIISLHNFDTEIKKDIIITEETVNEPEKFNVKIKRKNVKSKGLKGKEKNELSESIG